MLGGTPAGRRRNWALTQIGMKIEGRWELCLLWGGGKCCFVCISQLQETYCIFINDDRNMT